MNSKLQQFSRYSTHLEYDLITPPYDERGNRRETFTKFT